MKLAKFFVILLLLSVSSTLFARDRCEPQRAKSMYNPYDPRSLGGLNGEHTWYAGPYILRFKKHTLFLTDNGVLFSRTKNILIKLAIEDRYYHMERVSFFECKGFLYVLTDVTNELTGSGYVYKINIPEAKVVWRVKLGGNVALPL